MTQCIIFKVLKFSKNSTVNVFSSWPFEMTKTPHCKCFEHKNYGDWKLRGPCRENLHYLWKRAVRIVGKPRDNYRSCNYRGVSFAVYFIYTMGLKTLQSRAAISQYLLITCIKRENKNKSVFLKIEMMPQKVFEPIVPGSYIGLRVL